MQTKNNCTDDPSLQSYTCKDVKMIMAGLLCCIGVLSSITLISIVSVILSKKMNDHIELSIMLAMLCGGSLGLSFYVMAKKCEQSSLDTAEKHDGFKFCPC
jgi:hypothetical protein